MINVSECLLSNHLVFNISNHIFFVLVVQLKPVFSFINLFMLLVSHLALFSFYDIRQFLIQKYSVAYVAIHNKRVIQIFMTIFGDILQGENYLILLEKSIS